MMISQKSFKFSMFIGIIIVLLIFFFGYMFFEPYLTTEIIEITVVNKERFGNEPAKYLIFSEDEVFLNENNYYHEKENADELYKMFAKGNMYKVKVVGLYWPSFIRLRNIVKILEINRVPIRQKSDAEKIE